MEKNNLDYILPKIDINLIKKELNQDRFVRKTNKLENEIYIVNHHNSPNVMKEIGRLREVTFATAGGGTGLPIDIDEYDTNENCYQQLIVYSPEDEEIVGGYRFIACKNAISKDRIDLSTAHYFKFSNEFIEKYLPYTIELGRSWVQPNFQPANSRKGLFSLDNLWDGLGAIVVENPDIKYFFGKVTMYSSYNIEAKQAILAFMDYYFPDKENLCSPIFPIHNEIKSHPILELINQLHFDDGYKILQKYVRDKNEKIPPLINNYMGLSSTMKTFGTAQNPDFGNVEETGILVTIPDIYEEKKERHLTY